MPFDTLIDAATLHAHLSAPDWVVVDCRFNLMDIGAGRRAYREGHIPGAYYAHLDQDLSGPVSATTGRHPLPDPAVLCRTLACWGIGADTQVVAYDAAAGAMAARLWWLLRWLGHAQCAVLDGGLPAWLAAGYPLSREPPEPDCSNCLVAHPDPLAWVDHRYVQASLEGGQAVLVDARAAPRFRGEQEPIDPVAGHVPGAVNLPMEGNLDESGRFLSQARLRERFAPLLAGRSPAQVLHMCGSGVTACHNLLAMEVAGLHGSRLYAGSWSEWIRDPARPVARGDH